MQMISDGPVYNIVISIIINFFYYYYYFFLCSAVSCQRVYLLLNLLIHRCGMCSSSIAHAG